MSTELESGYYWVIQRFSHSWEISYYSKANQVFRFIGNNETVTRDWIDEIDETPIKRA